MEHELDPNRLARFLPELLQQYVPDPPQAPAAEPLGIAADPVAPGAAGAGLSKTGTRP